MKRFFILASAAIVALASCAKTEVVYKDAPQEIAFKQITNVLTKAGLGDNEDVKIGVYADYQDLTNATVSYFNNVPFDKDGSSWSATPKKYYPVSGELDFVGYAPYAQSDVASYASNKLKLTLTDNNTNQYDLLYSAKIQGVDKTEGATAQTMSMYHALAKIQYSITANTGVTVNTVTLEDIYEDGVYTVNYSDFDNKTGRWDVSNVTKTDWTTTSLTDTRLVVPGEQTKITLNYTMLGAAAVDHTITLNGNWEEGKLYTYNITITPKEIIFAPSVTGWVSTPVTVPAI